MELTAVSSKRPILKTMFNYVKPRGSNIYLRNQWGKKKKSKIPSIMDLVISNETLRKYANGPTAFINISDCPHCVVDTLTLTRACIPKRATVAMKAGILSSEDLASTR